MSSDEKPPEFTDVAKPAILPTANKITPPSEQIAGRTAQWDKFLGEVNDSYINTLRTYAPKNEYTIDINGETKTYLRKKIRAKAYVELEKLRAKFLKAQSNNEDPEKASELQLEIYAKCFESYLGGSLEEFNNADFEEAKKILDACNFRTQHGFSQ